MSTSPTTSLFARHPGLTIAALLATGTLAALLIAEVVLRLRDPLGQRLRGDQILLPTNVRHVVTHAGNPLLDPESVFSRNSLGFRGPEPPADFDAALTLLAVGGSTTECRHLTDGKDWPAELARRLAPSFRDLWVNNAGLDGHSSFGHLKLMEQRIARLRPKVVLLLMGINDIERDDLKYQDKALGNRDDVAWTTQGVLMWASRHSAVLATGINLWRGKRAERMRLTHRSIHLETLPRVKSGRRRGDAILADHRAEYLPAYRQRVGDLLRVARAAGIEAVLVTQPALYGPAVDDRTGVDLRFVETDPDEGINGNVAWRVLELYNDVLREAGREHSVLVVDLGQRLPKSSRLFYDFVHFTNQGAADAAAIIARDLCPWLAERFPAHATDACPEG